MMPSRSSPLSVSPVTHEEAPERLTKGLAGRWIPIILPARPVVERRWRREGVGKALLMDAQQRTLQAADLAAIRALNPAAAEWVHARLIMLLNGHELCSAGISPPAGLSFRPTEGWRGCSELVEKEEACRAR